MVTAKWCCENINSGHFKFRSVLGEVKELFQARSLSNLKEEIGDVLYFIYCWLYSNYRINLPMLGAMSSVYKFKSRLIVWEVIFLIHGLEFHPRYLVNGSNYDKEYKVEKALQLARESQQKQVL